MKRLFVIGLLFVGCFGPLTTNEKYNLYTSGSEFERSLKPAYIGHDMLVKVWSERRQKLLYLTFTQDNLFTYAMSPDKDKSEFGLGGLKFMKVKTTKISNYHRGRKKE